MSTAQLVEERTSSVRQTRQRLGQFRAGLAERQRSLESVTWYRWASPLVKVALAVIVVVAFVESSNEFISLITGTAIIYAISALGLSWLMGRAGLVSIGNGALMAVGGYITAIGSTKWSWAVFPIPIILSALGGIAIGLLIGLPALRLRGVYLALATLSLQFFVVFVGDQYQRHNGLASGVPSGPISIGGTDFGYGKDINLILFGFLALAVIIVKVLYGHGPGRMWGAIRESELAASVVGVNIARWKLSAFVGSSAMIAVSGSLLAYYSQIISSDTYTLDFAITFIVMIIIGGMGTITGALIGAAIVVSMPHILTMLTHDLSSGPLSGWIDKNIFYLNNGVYGILVLAFLLFQPAGIWPGLIRLWQWFLDWIAPPPQGARSRAAAPAASLEAGEGTGAATVEVIDLPETMGNEIPSRGGTPVLEVRDLTVNYRTGARAVDGVSLRVEANEIVAILGRNGAGKTSTLRAISGYLKTEGVRLGGAASVGGVEILGRSPSRAAQLAVLVPERDKVFPSLSVAEHLRVAGAKVDEKDMEQEDAFSRIWARPNLAAGLLSGGERQLLALAIAWQLRPQLLMVDEFSLGLAPVMIQRVGDVIRRLRDEHGMTFLLVEQNAAAAMRLADYVYIMDNGKVITQGTPDEVAEHDLMLPVGGAA